MATNSTQIPSSQLTVVNGYLSDYAPCALSEADFKVWFPSEFPGTNGASYQFYIISNVNFDQTTRATINSVDLTGSKQEISQLPFLQAITSPNPKLTNVYRLVFTSDNYYINPDAPNDLTLSRIRNSRCAVDYFIFVTVLYTPDSIPSSSTCCPHPYTVVGSSGTAIKLIAPVVEVEIEKSSSEPIPYISSYLTNSHQESLSVEKKTKSSKKSHQKSSKKRHQKSLSVEKKTKPSKKSHQKSLSVEKKKKHSKKIHQEYLFVEKETKPSKKSHQKYLFVEKKTKPSKKSHCKHKN